MNNQNIEDCKILCYNNTNLLVIGGKKVDRITNGFIEQFSNDHELLIQDAAKLYEYFSNYCVVSKENGSENIDLEEISTGFNAQGIDGIAIIVNRRIVNTTDDIDELIRLNKLINVKFVLIQAKTSDAFENSEMLNFLTFSTLFFSDNTALFTTPEMKKFIELKEYILKNASKLESNPVLCLYYVTVGTWQNDDNLVAIINSNKNVLKGTNLFSIVNFFPCGAEEIQAMYRKTFSELTATFKFEKRVTMYSTNEDEMGYCGVLPFKEYRSIMLDENGTLKPVFEDNIRDFLGSTPDVNQAIESTIKNGDVNAFSMLNNGITVVANSSKLSGDIMTIYDYQIVNGCQTSHMLFQYLSVAPHINDLMIPIRIIVTKDEDLKNRITKATNNQTAIKKEQLEALSTFQKNLEEYYKTFSKEDEHLFYERRTGQYRNASVSKAKIITIPIQIKTVTAMFLNNPHGVSGQYGTIAKNVGNKIFKNTDKKVIYYTSALSLYRIECLLKANTIDKKYWKTRYHALMLFRIVVGGEDNPKFNQRKMEQYCTNILNALNSPQRCFNIFNGIINFIAMQNTDLDLNDRKTFERKETTDFLLNEISNLKNYLSQRNAM
jgi:hypothetical protein